MDSSRKENNPVHVLLLDPWADPATRNYTAPLADALAQRAEISLILYLNRKTVLALYEKVLARFLFRLFRAPVAYRPLFDLLLQPIEIARMFFCILRDKPDIIHATFMHPWITVLMPILRFRFPFAVTWHDLSIHEGEFFLRHRLAQWVQKRYASILFVHSEELRKRAISEHGIAPERLFVVPHGTYSHWESHAASDTLEEQGVFLFFGRMLPYKAPDVLFRAFKILLQSHPTARLIVAGAGDLSPYQNLMDDLGPSLEVHNRVIAEAEAARFFQRAIATVLCHREVTQSGIVFASASMKKAVIASRVGALAETIQDGKSGLLIPPDDVDALVKAMQWMIVHPEQRREMGLALHNWIISTHGPERVAEATVAGYRAALTAGA